MIVYLFSAILWLMTFATAYAQMESWMQRQLPKIGNRPLRSICITGSHDAGMSFINGSTLFATAGNTLTQTVNIGVQLALGARYFDLRPTIASGIFKTGHYSDLPVIGWQGANGESFSSIISEVNAFTAANAELVILNLSHGLNSDYGYHDLTQGDWETLFKQMLSIKNLYVAPNAKNVDLSSLTLNSFIGAGRPAVIVIVDAVASLGSFATMGFYNYTQFNVYNNYSNTDDLNTMISSQLGQMYAVRKSPTSQPFLLSWTLTLQPEDVPTTTILQLAQQANNALPNPLFNAITPNTFPNILYIDNYNSPSYTQYVMDINDHVS